MESVLPVLFLATFVALFGSFIVWGTGKLGPKVKPSKVKSEAYECGLPGQESGDSKIPIKFYLTAILFILFDIEIIFMYPWAVAYTDFIEEGFGVQALVVMGVFLLVFIVGLFWEIKSKALDWE